MAYKYTPAEGQVSVTVTALKPTLTQPQQVEIAIADNGIGISEKDSEVIFNRFNRITTTQGEFAPGAGIGLALVKELVNVNNGEIKLRSQLGQGSIFSIILPVETVQVNPTVVPSSTIAASIDQQLVLAIDETTTEFAGDFAVAAKSAIQAGQKPGQKAAQKKSLLIIDDNADMRKLLNTHLSGDYNLMSAANGQSGLDIAREHLPDLILSDIMMPLMDGYELAQLLKSDELTNHIPIILLTAKGSLESRLKGLQLLVDDYIAKPFNLTELSLRINNILSIRDILSKRAGQALDSTPQSAVPLNELEQQFLDKVNDQLANHYSNAELNTLIFSEALLMSEKQLQRKLKASFNLTFPELVRNYRLEQAVKLLASGQRASQIYYAIGFSSHAYFSRCFKAKFGIPPKQYQQTLAVE